MIELIQNRLYFCTNTPPPYQNHLILNIDNVLFTQEFIYEPFASDFGPLNLSMTIRYCQKLERLLTDQWYEQMKICHVTSDHFKKLNNSIYLLGAFQILVLKRTAETAWAPFRHLNLRGYCDASSIQSSYQCSVLDCLKGLERAIQLNWLSYERFDLTYYETYDSLEKGDFHWIVPRKILAFSSPLENRNWRGLSALDYARLFQKEKISTVIRLNKPTYDKKVFERYGIRHFDLFFPDGSVPSLQIIERFIEIVDSSQTVAVHCKAGLGRTGTLIGCYLIKKFAFPAQEFIGWARICRPGSVLGPEEEFLVAFERNGRDGRLTASEMERARYGERGQADRLIEAKRFQTPDKTGLKWSETGEETRVRTRTPYRQESRTSYHEPERYYYRDMKVETEGEFYNPFRREYTPYSYGEDRVYENEDRRYLSYEQPRMFYASPFYSSFSYID